MSVYRPKGSSIYQYDFVLKGRRFYGTAGTSDHEEAKALEAKIRTDARRAALFGDPVKKTSYTINQMFGRYYEERSQFQSQASADDRRFALMIGLLGKDLPFQQLDDDRLALMVSKLRGRRIGDTDELVSNATVNRDIEALRRVWKRAVKIWKVEHGEEPIWSQHLLPEADERVRSLSSEEEVALFANLREDFHPIARFAIMGGMRIGNLRSLKWKDVDFQGGTVKMMLKSRKQGGRNHTVPLTALMLVLLANERAKHDEYVFVYQCQKKRRNRAKGEWCPFTKDGWRRPWAAALTAAGIEDFRFHDTRHTSATRTLRASGNLKAVQNMLGHTKITTTARYAHALQDDVRAAMESAQVPGNPRRKSKASGK